MASRALYSLAIAGNDPRIFKKCTKYGVPLPAVIASRLFCLLGYLNVESSAGVAFNWFISLTNTAGFTSWAVCCIILIRFRKACQTQGITVPYQSRFQPYAAWVCLFFYIFLLLLNGFTVFCPGRFTSSGFLTTYLGIPVFWILWAGHKLIFGRKDTLMYKPEDMDLRLNLAEVEADAQAWAAEDFVPGDGASSGKGLGKRISVIWG